MDICVVDDLITYPDALQTMEQRVADIRAGTAPEMVWLLEHPPLYTPGTSAKAVGTARVGAKKGFAALPADAKAAWDAESRNFVGAGKRYKTVDAWRERYAELYFQG